MRHLRSLMKKVRRGEGGFTLIELLVVVAILGAIAAVVVLNVGGFIGRGVCEGYCTEKHNVQTAVIAYWTEHSSNVTDGSSISWDMAKEYLTTNPKYTWGTGAGFPPDAKGKIGNASDAPDTDPPCECIGT